MLFSFILTQKREFSEKAFFLIMMVCVFQLASVGSCFALFIQFLYSHIFYFSPYFPFLISVPCYNQNTKDLLVHF